MLRLPVDEFLPAISQALAAARAVVVTAAPGAGKTTRVPPALAADGPVLLLQPRRVAARAIARRIAAEQGWTLGREVGWHVRFDRFAGPDTRLLVATEGMLTARVQQDPLLSDVRTVVIDEFHERSIHADLGIALVRHAWLARDDLRVVVMSATIDSRAVSRFFDHCPTVDVPGRLHPVETIYRPGVALEEAVADAMPGSTGALLCFLPGAGEIERTAEAIRRRLGPRVPIAPLHGGLDADAQDLAIAPTGGARIVLATNIAETTLTVPDVRIVIDAGLQKVARYDAARGLDSLDTERISLDAADQRAGRAGRVSAGRAIRLWDERDRLRPHREPDVARIDLASPALDVLAWGGDPRSFDWFEAPPREALDHALSLLAALGAVDEARRLTPLGRRLHRMPVHPRLARLLLEAAGAPEAARACAVLSERHFVPGRTRATDCDLLAAVESARDLPGHIQRVARDLRDRAAEHLDRSPVASIDDDAFRRAVLCAYPDRVGRRREPGSDRFLLASGAGARLARESGVVNAEFIVAVDVRAPQSQPGRPGAPESLVRLATAVDRDWLRATTVEVEHRIDEQTGRVTAVAIERLGAVMLGQRDAVVDPAERARLIAEVALRGGPSADAEQLLRRLAAVGATTAFADLVQAASAAAASARDLDLGAAVPPDLRRRLDRDAPVSINLPSGRSATLVYQADGRLTAAVKLQELFGLAATPRIGPRGTPVTFELLSPAGRPVQVTSDLRSFWTVGYPVVRKELRARYPKHPWPDDPWTATPTHRTVRKR